MSTSVSPKPPRGKGRPTKEDLAQSDTHVNKGGCLKRSVGSGTAFLVAFPRIYRRGFSLTRTTPRTPPNSLPRTRTRTCLLRFPNRRSVQRVQSRGGVRRVEKQWTAVVIVLPRGERGYATRRDRTYIRAKHNGTEKTVTEKTVIQKGVTESTVTETQLQKT